MSPVLIALIALATALVGPAAFNLTRRPDVRRVAVRNVARRRTETALVILGTALGTAIIAAAFMVGDTFESSIRDIARRHLGEVDIVLAADDTADLDAAEQALLDDPPPGIDGVIRIQSTRAAVSHQPPGGERIAEPQLEVTAADFDQVAGFGSAPDEYALAGARADIGQAILAADRAQDLGVVAGDRITLHGPGLDHDLEVAAVVAQQGLGGFSDVWVSQAQFDALELAETALRDRLAVSLDGTVFDTWGDELPINQALAEHLHELTISYDKADVLDDAVAEGDELTTIFSVVGGFSVLAGVLLLINLFVMLAEERKPNLGVLRAIGWKRAAMRRAFRAEGVLYAVPAAIVGAIAGIGVGWIMVGITQRVFEASFDDDAFQLTPQVEPTSLVTAGLVGLVIAMAAISFTSWRISRLNIVAAIRDLPEPRSRRSRLITGGAALAAVSLGAWALVSGLGDEQVYPALLSVPLIAAGLAVLTHRLFGPLAVTLAAAVGVLVWGMLFFEVLPGAEVEVEFFLLYGVVLVGAGVALATVAGTLLARLIGRFGIGGVAARLSMAYPTARVLRTASSLAMYSLIIFSLAFMAVMAGGIEASTDDIIEASSIGHDLVVDSVPANPLDADALFSVEGVESVATVTQTWTDWKADFAPGSAQFPQRGLARTATPELLATGTPALAERAPQFATDAQAIAAVTRGAGIVIAPWFMAGGADRSAVELGDTMSALTPGSEWIDFEVVGVLETEFTWTHAWIGPEAAARLDPDAVAARHYVATAPGVDPAAVVDRIEAAFVERGADADTFDDIVGRIIAVDLGFFGLLRGYLLLGLTIGIGGLAVTLFRAVRERRRQIGMLRSMGLASTGVSRWFLGEATFVSIMGIACGVGLGLLSGYFVNTQSSAVDEQLPFAVSWGVIALLIALPLAASALAALIPARSAAALRPSEALRVAD